MDKKTAAWIRLGVSSVIALVLVMILIVGISIHQYAFTSDTGDSAVSLEGQTIHAAPGELREIQLDWYDGTVTFVCDDQASDITIKESSSQSIPASKQAYCQYSDGVLTIDFQRSMRFSLFRWKSYKKNLTVTIPASVCDQEHLSMSLNSVSSLIQIQDMTVHNLTTDSVSGQVIFTGSADTIECNTVSGDVQITSLTTPSVISADSVSADIRIQIPANSQFQVSHDGLSGDFTLNGLSESESSDHHYSFDSVSGDILLSAIEN